MVALQEVGRAGRERKSRRAEAGLRYKAGTAYNPTITVYRSDMRLTFVDDSISFDGYSATSRPLDAPEKALVYLPAALVARGHDVQVFNRCQTPRDCFGARWEMLDGAPPRESDALIALRRPALLDFVPAARKKVLWVAGDSAALASGGAARAFERQRPLMVFTSEAARSRWPNALRVSTRIIEPGVAAAYLEEEPMAPADPPRAIATAHPLLGLEWLLRLWIEKIRPAAATAELHVYSAILDRGRLGAEIPASIRPALMLAQAGAPHGIVIHRPLADPGMAEVYRAARVHLHPGAESEAYVGTLAESQAVGLPGVGRTLGQAVWARIIDGQTGALCVDDDRFAAAAIELLTDQGTFERMSAAARRLQSGRSWHVAAAEWEEFLA
ncbi:MAG TPA: glycosyltransferase [Alphaproteobacteria bacterium]|nr:glycosyltransferase [Alphaproteobacteria bacterium]